jgi:hypothetical protein
MLQKPFWRLGRTTSFDVPRTCTEDDRNPKARMLKSQNFSEDFHAPLSIGPMIDAYTVRSLLVMFMGALCAALGMALYLKNHPHLSIRSKEFMSALIAIQLSTGSIFGLWYRNIKAEFPKRVTARFPGIQLDFGTLLAAAESTGDEDLNRLAGRYKFGGYVGLFFAGGTLAIYVPVLYQIGLAMKR